MSQYYNNLIKRPSLLSSFFSDFYIILLFVIRSQCLVALARCSLVLLYRAQWRLEASIVEQASSRGPPGTGWHHAEEPVPRRVCGPDAASACLPSSYALLLKGERCGVAAPRITAPHYPSTHSHSQAARVQMRRGLRISQPQIMERSTRSFSLFPLHLSVSLFFSPIKTVINGERRVTECTSRKPQERSSARLFYNLKRES